MLCPCPFNENKNFDINEMTMQCSGPGYELRIRLLSSSRQTLWAPRRVSGPLAPWQLAPWHLAPCPFATWPFAPWQLAPWTIRLNSPLGQLAPWTTRPIANWPRGQIASWITRPIDNSFHEQLAPWTVRAAVKISTIINVCRQLKTLAVRKT
jgi:hypothetical protein